MNIFDKNNYEDVFLRDLTVCVLATLEDKITWVNRFTSGDVNVSIPFYYSLTGAEDFLLDSFSDDIVSDKRFVELNTDVFPRAHITLSSWSIKSDEFANPNVWLKVIVENEQELRKELTKVRAIPILANYDVSIRVESERDAFMTSQKIMNTLWFYKYCYFEYNFMNIDCILQMPDEQQITINRETNLSGEGRNIKLDFTIQAHTYFPAYTDNQKIGKPRGVMWANQIKSSKRQ